MRLNSANAVSPTPTSATESAVQEIRDKVKEIVREQIEETQKGQKMAFTGELTAINDADLKIETNQGEKNLKIATDAAIINKTGKKIKIGELKTSFFAIAMGYLEDNDILGVRRLVVVEKPKANGKEAAFGKVTDISSEEKIITIKNEKKNLIYTIEIDDKTIITKKVENKDQKVKFNVVSKGDKLIAIGTPSENENKIITAETVYIISDDSTATSSSKTVSPTP
ncbi:MAG: hypothetical protein NT052_02030 [Candidatus Shapirobacteria bacterium]|nr:hypothetical protein [Candidatus Shapirobacteria bacterium]